MAECGWCRECGGGCRSEEEEWSTRAAVVGDTREADDDDIDVARSSGAKTAAGIVFVTPEGICGRASGAGWRILKVRAAAGSSPGHASVSEISSRGATWLPADGAADGERGVLFTFSVSCVCIRCVS